MHQDVDADCTMNFPVDFGKFCSPWDSVLIQVMRIHVFPALCRGFHRHPVRECVGAAQFQERSVHKGWAWSYSRQDLQPHCIMCSHPFEEFRSIRTALRLRIRFPPDSAELVSFCPCSSENLPASVIRLDAENGLKNKLLLTEETCWSTACLENVCKQTRKHLPT